MEKKIKLLKYIQLIEKNLNRKSKKKNFYHYKKVM